MWPLLESNATQCITLQRTVMHRNARQQVWPLLESSATHCNTLQYAATGVAAA